MDEPPEIDMELVREMAEKRATACHAIGNFLLEFSQLEFSIRVALAARLKIPDELFNIVTAPYDFAALCNVMKKLLTVLHPEKKDVVESLYNECQKLNNEARVRVAHGLWTEGAEGLMVRHVSRGSLEAAYYFEDPQELYRLADKAQELMQRVIGFQGRE